MRSRGCIVWALSHTATRRTRPRFWTYHAGHSAYLCIPYNTQLSTINRPGFLKVALAPVLGGGCGLFGALFGPVRFADTFWLGCLPRRCCFSRKSVFIFTSGFPNRASHAYTDNLFSINKRLNCS